MFSRLKETREYEGTGMREQDAEERWEENDRSVWQSEARTVLYLREIPSFDEQRKQLVICQYSAVAHEVLVYDVTREKKITRALSHNIRGKE